MSELLALTPLAGEALRDTRSGIVVTKVTVVLRLESKLLAVTLASPIVLLRRVTLASPLLLVVVVVVLRVPFVVVHVMGRFGTRVPFGSLRVAVMVNRSLPSASRSRPGVAEIATIEGAGLQSVTRVAAQAAVVAGLAPATGMVHNELPMLESIPASIRSISHQTDRVFVPSTTDPQ